jgi:hypothetical protein
MARKRRKRTAKKALTVTQKWNQLKRQTESAGMKVRVKNRKVVVARRSKRRKKR